MADLRISELLAKRPPSDSGGAIAANRLTFQQSWALCKLLELHSAGVDYTMIFDYHEDIVVLDSTDGDEHAEFYQVKSKEGKDWKMSDLFPSRKPKTLDPPSRSIIGKLREHELRFGDAEDNIRALCFVTNAGVALQLQSGMAKTSDKYCFAHLTESLKHDIVERLRREFADAPAFASHGKYWVVFTTLHPRDHESSSLGKLVEFLDAHIGARNGLDSNVYRVLADTIRKRSAKEGVVTTREALLAAKSLSRTQFTRDFLDDIRNQEKRAAIPRIEQDLIVRQIPFPQARAIANECASYFSKRNDLEDSRNADLRQHLIAQLQVAVPESATYATHLEDIVSKLKTRYSWLAKECSDNYIKAMVVIEYEEFYKLSSFAEKHPDGTS